jgi:type IV pilus assembly protein PilB
MMLAVRMSESKNSTQTPLGAAPNVASNVSDQRPRLGDLLVKAGIVERSIVERIALEARAHHERLGEALSRQGIVEPIDVYRALATQWRLPFSSVESLSPLVDATLCGALPRGYLDRNGIFPITRSGDEIVIATTDPTVVVDDVLKALHSRAARLVLVTPTDYRRLWMLTDLRHNQDDRVLASTGATPGIRTAAPADLLAQDTKAHPHHIAIFEALLIEAISERASDIHLEHEGNRIRIRLRIDGDLWDLDRIHLAPNDLAGLVNVIKVQAHMDIAEHRIPQGGRIRRHAGGKAFDMRVQTQPCLHGENVVIRLLAQETKVLRIEDLGISEPIARSYRRLLDSPGGLVLVVGPTGSGKSTTLYAGLQYIAQDATRKVITIEDPIEYAIAGVQQAQARPDLGFSFANAMRAFVREDPDVILVGEIRDEETALEAIRASQTGHLVLSTLHCNDTIDAVQRLIDLGLHPNSVASELVAVIAQRLAKRICEECRVPVDPDPEIAAELFPLGWPSDMRVFKGRGCTRCHRRGTHGRIAVVEFLRLGSEIRKSISHRVPVDELRDIALDAGSITMRQSALELVHAGTIPLSEVPWLLPAERMAGVILEKSKDETNQNVTPEKVTPHDCQYAR